MGFGNPDFNVFELPEEHVALREAIRALSELSLIHISEPTRPY